MRPVGRVTLVGAGPGSADLITVRGASRLAEADLVLYDALSSEGMRDLAPHARWFYVGKRACRNSINQDVLNRLMIKHALRGRHVVRLKCGDPFVFGRGGLADRICHVHHIFHGFYVVHANQVRAR